MSILIWQLLITSSSRLDLFSNLLFLLVVLFI